MKKTYITKLPDKSGAFLEASRIIAQAGANITRVSYNKAVDTHALFIDVDGDPSQLDEISQGLERVGYIMQPDEGAEVMLLEFRLLDVPGAVLPVLELIHRYRFNISYISSHENGTPFQHFKMGLFVEDHDAVKDFIEQATKLCEVKVLEYNPGESVLDNTVFYLQFANQLAQKLGLGNDETIDLIAQSNRIMQMLDEKNEPAYKTFEHIGKIADMLAEHTGDNFNARVSRRPLNGGAVLHLIEPPCGSNTFVLEKAGKLLFVDTGFACYKDEMLKLLRGMFPAFDSMHREAVITHPDVDHCGLLPLFDTVYVSRQALEHFTREQEGRPNFREMNEAHAPYSRISHMISGYAPPALDTLKLINEDEPEPAATDAPIEPIGTLEACGFAFKVFRGNGGHAVGEVALVEEADRLVFSGDIVVNPEGFTPEQDAFNRLAPYLMTSVNMDSRMATTERRYLVRLFPESDYTYCCGHGALR